MNTETLETKKTIATPESSYKMLIGGEWVESNTGRTFENFNPANGEKLTEYPLADASDVDRAVKAAKVASKTWGKSSTTERQNALLKIADLMEAQKQRFVELEALDTGKPVRESGLFDVPLAIDHFRYWAGVIRSHTDEVAMIDDNTMSIALSEPIGVVGQVVPWNYPIFMAAWKLAPAIATGNTVVLKPSELTSITTLELGKILNEVLPEGVVNIVTGYGPEAGQAILDHEGTDKLAFTGSTRVGYAVAEAAAKKLVPATLELGGKSANIVFEDANWDKAVEGAVSGILLSQGQVCESGSRLFVQEDIYDKFVAEIKERFEAVKVGDPMDETTQMGTQMSQAQLDRVLSYIDIAKEEGATILTGGNRITRDGLDKGFFVEPTIIVDAKNEMRISQEEIFGPVLVVIPFKTEEEVVKMANDNDYGLAGAVWTQDINRAIRVARSVETGRMWVNTFHEIPAHAPFGGYKKSGLGREAYKSMIAAYTRTKNIYISTTEGTHGLF